jgi:phospholipid/cholesterol/gamma-HCH transport system substrate-binding protein
LRNSSKAALRGLTNHRRPPRRDSTIMYASRTTQIIVGMFTLLGVAAMIFLSVRLGRVEIIPAPGYTLYANFDNIAGLKTGSEVEIAGVKVGKVGDISLKDNRAHVAMRINEGVAIDDDAIASVLTSGLIGDKYVSIALGAGDDLKDGGTIRQTQSAFVLENAIGAFINSGGSSKGAGSSGSAPGGGPSSSNGSTPGSGAPNNSVGQTSGAQEKK